MYAIVEIAGKQFKVSKDQYIYIPKMEMEIGAPISFEKILLLQGETDLYIGNPVVEGAKVAAKVLDHVKGDKIIIFKKKRRQGYKKKQGHRQGYTKILIENIVK
jgi:large subunit ribosomal protein L21